MTQAVNLANFANSLNSSGQLDPAALSSAVPVSKGGTGSTTASSARTSLGVPANDGTGASGTWSISISGNATTATNATNATTATNATNATNAGKVATTNWTIQESGGVLVFQYGGVTKFTMSSDGSFSAAV